MIERHRLRSGRVDRSGDGVGAAEGKLLQDVLLESRGGDGGRRDDGQRDAHPLAVEEEEQLVVENRAAQAAAEMIHGGARLVIARRGVGEVIGRIQNREPFQSS